jgi:hypothetical protein
MTHDLLIEQGSAFAALPRDSVSKMLTILLTHEYLHQGNELANLPRYSLDRPRLAAMPAATLDQLILICSNNSTPVEKLLQPGNRAGAAVEPPLSHRGRGAPLGNTNALKHGLYSERIASILAGPRTHSLDTELAIVQAITEDLLANPDAPVELILKSVTSLARLKVAAAAMSIHFPPQLEPPSLPHPPAPGSQP